VPIVAGAAKYKSMENEMEGGGGSKALLGPHEKKDSFNSTAKIGTWMMVGLIFFSVSGGPVGMEVSVKAGGPFLAILGFTVMPFIWSLPEAAMTAELSIAYPEVLQKIIYVCIYHRKRHVHFIACVCCCCCS
jgi:hypothetical protein